MVLSLKENLLERLWIYPNPVSNFVTIKGLKTEQLVSVLNISGQVLFTTFVTQKNSTLNICQLSEGIYFLKLGSSVLKFVKH